MNGSGSPCHTSELFDLRGRNNSTSYSNSAMSNVIKHLHTNGM